MTRNQAHCRDQNDEETLMKWVACAESAVEIFANGQVRLSRLSDRASVTRTAGNGRQEGANHIKT